MAVRPHPSKSKKEPGRWWYVDIGYNETRQRILFEGSYDDAVRLFQELTTTGKQQRSCLLPRLAEMVVPFLEWYEHEAAPNTVEDVRRCIGKHIIPALGKYRPDQLGQTVLDDFRAALGRGGASPRTVNKVLSYLSTIIKWGVASGRCKEAPGKMPRYSRRKTEAEPRTPLTAEQVDAIFAALPRRCRLPYLLMVDHGLRREEALSLKWEDVDMVHKIIRILGKGGKWRHVPFMSARFEEELARAESGGVYVTANPQTGKPYLNIRKALLAAAKQAGVPAVGHHLLRHTFASRMAERGMSPYVLQKLMGHVSQETTNKIYVHIGEDFVAAEARKFAADDSLSKR